MTAAIRPAGSTAHVEPPIVLAEFRQDKALRKRNLSGRTRELRDQPSREVTARSEPSGTSFKLPAVDPISTCPNAKNFGGLGAEPPSLQPTHQTRTQTRKL